MAIAEINRSSLPLAAQRQLIAMLQAAANPNAESAAEVIKTLDPERRANVEATIRQLAQNRRAITRRGRAGLRAMSDDEWQRLVDEADSRES